MPERNEVNIPRQECEDLSPDLFIGDFAQRGQSCQLLFCRRPALEMLISRGLER
jgi:hypothetical protein